MDGMQDIGRFSNKSVVRGVFLPGIIPRLKRLFTINRGIFAYIISSLFISVGLLPKTFSNKLLSGNDSLKIVNIIAVAKSNIEFKWKNIDQILIFFTVISGLVILFLYLFALVIYFLITPALALPALNPPDVANMFVTYSPTTDIAFKLMDSVFGVPGIFDSGSVPIPGVFHRALQEVISLYSGCILLFASIIFLYYIFRIIGEIAVLGKPFGESFNPLWTPVRLMVALAMLMPVSYGLNGIQYAVMYVAKFGSGLGTNIWTEFNSYTSGTFMGLEPAQIIVKPKPQTTMPLIQFMYLVNGCRMMYQRKEFQSSINNANPYAEDFLVQAYVVSPGIAKKIGDQPGLLGGDIDSYEEISDFYRYKDIRIVFGIKRAGSKFMGEIDPVCGSIVIPFTPVNEHIAFEYVQQYYFDMIMNMWIVVYNDLFFFNHRITEMFIRNGNPDPCVMNIPGASIDNATKLVTTPDGIELTNLGKCDSLPLASVFSKAMVDMNTWLQLGVDIGYNNLITDPNINKIDDKILNLGWAGAGIWFNRISQLNGALTEAVINTPFPDKYPKVMEEVERYNKSTQVSMNSIERFDPYLAGDDVKIEFKDSGDKEMAVALYTLNKYWQADDPTAENHKAATSTNGFIKILDAIFGTTGLFNLRENTAENVNPLAQLSAAGKALVSSSIRNLMVGTGAAMAGGISEAVMGPDSPEGQAARHLASAMMSIAGVTLIAGFMLHYIIPILPFMYFFFAVGDWIKSIFEAIVAAPLWALAHITMDGTDFISEKASEGYMLLLEILIRPTLTVFGLMASMSIYSALVLMLNDTFAVIEANFMGASGAVVYDDPVLSSMVRSRVDQLFITIVYAFLAYMLALNCFKLIDAIPDGILRWVGGSTKSFSDIAGDPAEQMTEYTTIGGNMMTGEVVEAANAMGGGIGKAAGGLVANMKYKDMSEDEIREYQAKANKEAKEGEGSSFSDLAERLGLIK